jgi:DNA recombination protein RmuC
MVIVALLIGIAVGALVVLVAVRPALVDRRRREREVIDLGRSLAATEAELRVERESADARLQTAVKALSSEALDANSSRFLELAETHLTGHVKPLKESLERMDRQLQTVERVRQESYGALQTQVSTLAERAGSLTNALRTPHVRGRWGEAQLRNVVEHAGMVEHCDYETQATTATDDGMLRPDLVVRIPGGKHVVIDAKAPLVAYLDAFETSDDAERQLRLADHARQVRDHVGKLSAKGYWRQFDPSPDFVVMFLPDESYLRAAHEHDPSLQEYAWSSNVILASPSTLMVLLRTVAMTWQQETIAESAREVSDLGRELYKRLSTMGTHFAKLGRTLGGAVDAYNQTVGSLERQVLPQARRFEQHGISGIEPPELQPIERRPRPLAAAELVGPEMGDDEQQTLEAVAGIDAA